MGSRFLRKSNGVTFPVNLYYLFNLMRDTTILTNNISSPNLHFEKKSSILTNNASSKNLHFEKESSILSNTEKSLVIAGKLHFSTDILKTNKLEFVESYIAANMPMSKNITDLPIDVLVTQFSGVQLENIIRTDSKIVKKDKKGFIKQAINESYLDLKRWLSDLGIVKSIAELKILKKLNLSDKGMVELSDKIGHLVSLKELYLDNNSLKEIPREIGNLVNLETLSINNNRLEGLPKEIGNLKLLKVLALNNNRLRKLPKEIGELSKLEIIQVNDNRLKELPKEIEKLSLKELMIVNNPLEKLPENIMVEKLYINKNIISEELRENKNIIIEEF
jgi:Leucine-rich repeat (LRR) protein